MKNSLLKFGCSLFALAFLHIGEAGAVAKKPLFKLKNGVVRSVSTFGMTGAPDGYRRVLSLQVDLWTGSGETVLIGAGISVVDHPMGEGAVTKVNWTKRRLITSDVILFSNLGDNVFRVEMSDKSISSPDVTIELDLNNLKMNFMIPEFDVLDETLLTAFLLNEPDYMATAVTGRPIVFESGNPRMVPFSVFFANRGEFSAQLLAPRQSATVGPNVVPGKTVVMLAPRPQESPPPGLSKKQLKKWKRDREQAENAAAKTKSKSKRKSGGYSTWVGGDSGSKYPPLPPPPPAKITIEGFDGEIEALLAMDAKPELKDIVGLMRLIRTRNPDYDLKKNPFGEFLKGSESSILYGARQMTAVRERLEKAFPGAVWHILGRDAYLFGDALEAEYLRAGETDRVVRLPASQPSFIGAELDLVYGFMRDHGIDLEKVADDPRPHIVLDISSYSNSEWRLSQSRHLMRAAYDQWAKMGRAPEDLASKVNFVNVSRSHGHAEVESAREAQEFLKNLKYSPEPEKIMSVYGPSEFLYTDAWHGLYRKFEKDEQGHVTAPHDGGSSLITRRSMLGELWALAAHFELYDNKLIAESCEGKLVKQ